MTSNADPRARVVATVIFAVLVGIVFAYNSGGWSAFLARVTGAPSTTPGRNIDSFVMAADLFADYAANEVAADQKYRNTVVCVTGTVDVIGKDMLDRPYLLMRGTERQSVFGVQGLFPNEAESGLAAISKGQRITMTCRCDGKAGNVILKDCRL